MPLYEYQCIRCENKTKRLATVTNRDHSLECAKCSAPMYRIEFPEPDIKPSKVRDVFKPVKV